MTSQELLNQGYVREYFSINAPGVVRADDGSYWRLPGGQQQQQRAAAQSDENLRNIEQMEQRAAEQEQQMIDTGQIVETPEMRREFAQNETPEQREERLRFLYEEAVRRATGQLEAEPREIQVGLGRARQREYEAGQLEEKSLRAEAANALAAALSSGAPIGSGAASAAARQTGLETGLAAGRVRAGVVRKQSELEREALQGTLAAKERARIAELEGIAAMREAGTSAETKAEDISKAESQVQAAIKSNTDTFGLDEEDAAEDIRTLKAQYTDPAVKNYLEKRAKDIEARSWF